MIRWLPFALALAACDDAPTATPLADAAPADQAVDAAPEDAGIVDAEADAAPCPEALADRAWAPPSVWARPIDDYIAAGEAAHPDDPFLRGVHDLAVFDDHLWLGYGDATYNLGRVQLIQFRGFTDPDDPTAVVAEFDSRDEHLDGFRRFGDELLMPGIDAIDDAWLGNIYLRRVGEPWRMARTVDRGVHVHDVVRWGASLYAVGSGATPQDWNRGNIYGYLWVSRDEAESWTLVHQAHNQRMGDSRLVRLLPLDDGLYAFGYRSDNTGSIVAFHGGTYDGVGWRDLPEDHPLRSVFVSQTHPIDLSRGLVRGADVSSEPFRDSMWVLGLGGEATRVEAYAGHTVVDVEQDPVSGDWVILTREGDVWGQSPATWVAQVWIGADPAAAAPVLRFEVAAPLLSVAAWSGALFFGDAEGRVLRAACQSN